jgi:hypothetical protein
MANDRQKNARWSLPEEGLDWGHARLAVLMDIRDELQSINAALRCFRIPRALDAMYELGLEARRKKRLGAKKRKAAREQRR